MYPSGPNQARDLNGATQSADLGPDATPPVVDLDLTALWHRETELIGTYTYGTEELADGRRTTSYELAFELAGKVPFDKMVSATYPLARYVEAIAHAADAGPRGAVKVAFDMRDEKRRLPAD